MPYWWRIDHFKKATFHIYVSTVQFKVKRHLWFCIVVSADKNMKQLVGWRNTREGWTSWKHRHTTDHLNFWQLGDWKDVHCHTHGDCLPWPWLSHDCHDSHMIVMIVTWLSWLSHDCHMIVMIVTWMLWLSHDCHDCRMVVTWLSWLSHECHDCHMIVMIVMIVTWLSWLSHDCHMIFMIVTSTVTACPGHPWSV